MAKMLTVVLLLITLVIFLYSLFVLSNDDFVIIRKGVAMDTIFNLAFFTFFVGLFSARLIFVAEHFSTGFLHPLVFFLFPYFPGLSLAGGVVGSISFMFFFSKKKKLPSARLFDFFLFSFLATLPFGFFLSFLFGRLPVVLIGFVSYCLLLGFLVWYILPQQRRGDMKDGILGLFILVSVSFVAFVLELIQRKDHVVLVFSSEALLFAAIFLSAFVLLLRLENVFSQLKKGSQST